MELHFGAGAFWGNRTDVTGSGIGPDQFAALQDITIDFGFDIRPLHGQYQFPLDVARGKGKVSGKAKAARFFGAIYGDLFFGQTPTTGMTAIMEDEQQPIPGVTPFNVSVANAATFVDDLGVYFASGVNAGKRLVRKTTAAATGEYSVNLTSGAYTFVAADLSLLVNISYIYTDAVNGKKITITNQLMGFTPYFKGSFFTQKSTQGLVGKMALVLNQCTANRLSFATRLDDYEIPEFDFEAMADGSNTIGTLSVSE